jgi:lyso-ornithine lipid O-acyltransferase
VTVIGWVRIWARFLTLILLLIAMVPLHYAFRMVRITSPFPQAFLGMAARVIGARVRVHGTHLRRDVFYLSNHISWIDILAIGGACGSAFVAKAEVKRTPVVGWLADLNKTLYVAREARGSVAAQINALRDALAETWAITVFPEGTTGNGRALLPFKAALLKVLEPPPPGILVQPIYLDYGAALSFATWLGDEHGKDNALRILAHRGSFDLGLHFLEPFDPAAFSDRKAIAAEAEARIKAAMETSLSDMNCDSSSAN